MANKPLLLLRKVRRNKHNNSLSEVEKIQLNNTLPHVFANSEDMFSDIWRREVTFERGKSYLIIAESGTGKSSLCSYIYGYRVDYSGDILFDGKDIKNLTIAQWCEVRRREIAYLPQDMRLFPELTTMENIELKNSMTHFKTTAQIEQMLERLGIAEKRDALVGNLSIGQQQRVALVRTLCQPAQFILLDEPVSHLDAANNETVAQMVREEAQSMGAAVIATSVGNNVMLDFDFLLRLSMPTI